jgi:pyridoxal phosphate enzyme (YggS family)
VSKTVPLERLALAVEAGHDRLGENRVQEAADKAPALPAVEWHLVGHLQRNKAARAVELFDVIGAVDSLSLAERLDRIVGERRTRRGAARLAVHLQVNVDDDPSKEGFAPADLERDLGAVLALPHLDVAGLMTVGRLSADRSVARATFAGLRGLSASLRGSHPGLGAGLSMGMSDDFEIAIEEGSTLVRVGRALFGERPSA